jgi:prepilin-type N-terminal cleavage/methylation domain-containing protein
MMHSKGHRRRTASSSRAGFTLIEVAITTVIIALGTVAMMALMAAGTSTNQQTAYLTTAVDLANNIHELCDQLSYPTSGTWGLPAHQTVANAIASGNISWLDGQTLNPPVDATGSSISGMGIWSQQVAVTNVSTTNITTTLSTNAFTNPLSRVTVTILLNGNQVFQTDWLVAQ